MRRHRVFVTRGLAESSHPETARVQFTDTGEPTNSCESREFSRIYKSCFCQEKTALSTENRIAVSGLLVQLGGAHTVQTHPGLRRVVACASRVALDNSRRRIFARPLLRIAPVKQRPPVVGTLRPGPTFLLIVRQPCQSFPMKATATAISPSRARWCGETEGRAWVFLLRTWFFQTHMGRGKA
jgi:hypothetical protein